MRTIGVYLIFAAVVLRAAVVLSDTPEFFVVIALLGGYGLLLLGETELLRRKPVRLLQSRKLQLAYLLLQSVLVIGILIVSSYEDFLAMLFIPLSLDAVSFFGRRSGFVCIGIFSLALTTTLLFSEEGIPFGLAMGSLYSGVCFLFGGYAHQVLKAEAAQDQNQRIFNELQIAHHQLQGYADQVASLAVEHERNRLARDLHDSVTQTVFSMNLTAQSARLLLDKEPPRAVGQLLHLEELAANALREIQSLVSQLKPRSIAEEGLPTALRRFADERGSRDGLQLSLEIHEERTLSEAETLGLYAIAHEALTNVIKHSGVRQATIRLNLEAKESCLEIEDHGLGFEPQTASGQPGHLGLAGMSERAQEIGWKLCVESQPGQGTRILVTQNQPGGGE
ncbi:MAG TPA: sensor histidine kinase [Anaerolineales bacterium]|nr:sensor histidine kinase [Anaerolineales bacterium]